MTAAQYPSPQPCNLPTSLLASTLAHLPPLPTRKPNLSFSEDVNSIMRLISSEPLCDTSGPWHKTLSPYLQSSQAQGIWLSPPHHLSQAAPRSHSRRPSPGHTRSCLPSERASAGVRWLLQCPGGTSLISPFHVSPQWIYVLRSTPS